MEINFKKVHTLKDLAISTIVLLYKGGYKKDGQGIVLQKKSEELCKACRTSIVEFLEGKNTVPTINLWHCTF